MPLGAPGRDPFPCLPQLLGQPRPLAGGPSSICTIIRVVESFWSLSDSDLLPPLPHLKEPCDVTCMTQDTLPTPGQGVRHLTSLLPGNLTGSWVVGSEADCPCADKTRGKVAAWLEAQPLEPENEIKS